MHLILHFLGEYQELCGNTYLYVCLCVCVYRHVAALGAARVTHFIKNKCCGSDCPLLKAVRGRVSSLQPRQDILEFCNWKRRKGRGISVWHSRGHWHGMPLPVPDAAPSSCWGGTSGHSSQPPCSEENCWLRALMAPQGPAPCSARARGNSGSSPP